MEAGHKVPMVIGKYKSLDAENKKVEEGSHMIKGRALGDLREHTSVSKHACSAVGHIRCSKKPGSDRKPEGILIKPPSDALPFSDEWLAAREAAGEVILLLPVFHLHMITYNTQNCFVIHVSIL